MSRPPRVGWLFAHDWDGAAGSRLQAAGMARFDRAGFDLFRFPRAAQLAGLQPIQKCVQGLISKRA